MKNNKNNIHEIQKELRRIKNDQIASHSQRFFKTGKGEYAEGDKFLGIRVPTLRNYVKQYKDISIEDTLELLGSEFHEERLFALLAMVELFRKGDSEVKQKLFQHYLENTKQINNWDLVDLSAVHIVGAFLMEKDKQILYTLAHSTDLWERRISIIATFHFIKNESFQDAINIAEILLEDRHDLIHKAVGWMLREVGKRDVQVEERFLEKYYKKMPRTMLRYAIEKFPEQKRKMYLTGLI